MRVAKNYRLKPITVSRIFYLQINLEKKYGCAITRTDVLEIAIAELFAKSFYLHSSNRKPDVWQ